MKVFIDAGSTTEELVRVLCKKIENRALNRITVATSSIKIADMVSDCCVRMGFDDGFSAVRLYVPGGEIRPNTQAIVSSFGIGSHIKALADSLGGFDLGIVGVNGIDELEGFSTHGNAEAANKLDIFSVCRSRIIAGDSSKVGIKLEYRFAGFDDDLTLVIDDAVQNESLQAIIRTHATKIAVA